MAKVTGQGQPTECSLCHAALTAQSVSVATVVDPVNEPGVFRYVCWRCWLKLPRIAALGRKKNGSAHVEGKTVAVPAIP